MRPGSEQFLRLRRAEPFVFAAAIRLCPCAVRLAPSRHRLQRRRRLPLPRGRPPPLPRSSTPPARRPPPIRPPRIDSKPTWIYGTAVFIYIYSKENMILYNYTKPYIYKINECYELYAQHFGKYDFSVLCIYMILVFSICNNEC